MIAGNGRRRLVTGVVAGLVAGVGLVAVTGSPALADAFVREENTSGLGPATVKQVRVTCPAGLSVYGTGGDIDDGAGRVALTGVVPDADLRSVTATGVARPGFAGSWAVRVYAVCASFQTPDGPSLVRSTDGSGRAECGAGLGVAGAGFDLGVGLNPRLLTALVAETSAPAVRVEASQVAGPLVAYAICVPVATVPRAYRITRHPGPAPVLGRAPTRVQAVSSGSLTTGVFGRLVGDADGVAIDALVPDAGGAGARVRASAPPAGTRRALVDPDGWAVDGSANSVYYY